jgi:hypothetical protein
MEPFEVSQSSVIGNAPEEKIIILVALFRLRATEIIIVLNHTIGKRIHDCAARFRLIS